MADSESLAMKAQIKKRLNKHNLYDTLDIDKHSTSQDIKKAYKKLALRFHPDKNKIQGSKDVFNKISHAYNLLSDQKKKIDYDESERKKHQQGQNVFFQFNKNNNFSNFRNSQFNNFNYFHNLYEKNKQQQTRRTKQQTQKRRKQYQKQRQQMQREFTKLFSKMFETKASKQKPKQYNKNQQKQYIQKMKAQYREEKRAKQRKQRLQKQQLQNKNLIIFFAILFMVIVFGPTFLNMISSKPVYSFVRTNIHKLQLKTPILNFPYFVSQSYYDAKFPEEKKNKIIEMVDRKFINNLKKDCLIAQNQRKGFEQKALKQRNKKKRQIFLQKARNVNDDGCTILFQYNKIHPQYIKLIQN